MIPIDAYWKAVLAQDADAMRAYFAPHAYVNWHNTNEHFTVEEFIRANCDYPGDWSGRVERALTTGDMIITAVHVYRNDGVISCHVTSFIQTDGSKITAIDEYWGDDGPAPLWRQEMKLGTKIRQE